MSLASDQVRGARVPRTVGAAAEAALEARGDVRRLSLVLEHSAVPIVIVDAGRNYIEANRPARLVFRLSLAEVRERTIDDLTSACRLEALERSWAQLLETGCVAGAHEVASPDDSSLEVVYCSLANLLPGLHVIAFAPAGWPDDELGPTDEIEPEPPLSLSPREVDVLALAAEGSSQVELAEHLGLSPATVKTHLANIYVKLGVRNRAGAVARAMRLGVIQ